jgi:hypothetical protein
MVGRVALSRGREEKERAGKREANSYNSPHIFISFTSAKPTRTLIITLFR